MKNRQAVQMLGLAVVLGSTGWAQVTQRVSVDSGGAQGNDGSFEPSVSADGRYVAFTSASSNLVPGDTTGFLDVFVRDRLSGVTERVSVDSGGAPGNSDSGVYGISISADGRYVAFDSLATNLVPADTNGALDVFVRDRLSGTTTRVSVDSGGAQGNSDSFSPSISADGLSVAFESFASNLISWDTNGVRDIFYRAWQNNYTEIVSVDSSAAQANGDSYEPAISADGRYVAFTSDATNLVPGDTNGFRDVFVRSRSSGTTTRVSVDSVGSQANGNSYSPSISADGLSVAFESLASNLINGGTNGRLHIFYRAWQNNYTEIVSVDSSAVQGNGNSFRPSITADGRYVAFASFATNLVPGDTNGFIDVFVRSRSIGTTQRVSLSSSWVQGNDDSCYFFHPSYSADGRYVAFESFATNLVPGDTNGSSDIFIRDRNEMGFTSLCDPGVGGVIACPCGNPPSGSGRGCDNSAATGGAILSASGIAYLSMDSLVFTTAAEKPTATSIVLQGTASPVSGLVYGQGVRCVGGTLKRLFTKAASGGSITAPNFGAGDPSISARSAAKGDTIQPGQSRWYLVYYRDPTVLGGCPASSTFNATQTGQIDWSL